VTAPSHPVRRPDDAGVTLIELMIVLVIISIGILALAGVQTRSSTDVYATGRRSRAVAVAQTRLEVQRALGFGAALTDSGVADGCTWVTVVDSVDIGLNRITTTSSWLESGTQRTVRLMNLVSQR
jgi:prepilin-type N-terminal cleavage/methylation domain-containing protein